MTAHKHVELMAQYVEDARETDKPWERWEMKGFYTPWTTLSRNPDWLPSVRYRRKPRTININGHEVPEPMRKAPEVGTKYYLVACQIMALVVCTVWSGEKFDNLWLQRGLCHLTRESAEMHAKALLSFTVMQP